MTGFQWMSGVLASTAFVGAAMASEPPAVPKDDPAAVCAMDHFKAHENKPTMFQSDATLRSCLAHVKATQLIKEGKTQEALEVLQRSIKSEARLEDKERRLEQKLLSAPQP